MSPTSEYHLLPTSPGTGSTETLPDVDLEENSWQPQRRGWLPLAFAATRRSRFARRPHTVTVAAVSTLCLLALLTAIYDHSFIHDEPPRREHVVRDCFELPVDELEWRTTQLPAERSELCPFDPESFAVLREDPAHRFPNSRQNHWSTECLEHMLADGQAQPRSCDQTRTDAQAQNIDLVWTWVNGSSTLLELTRQDRVAEVSGVPQADLDTDEIAGLAARLFR